MKRMVVNKRGQSEGIGLGTILAIIIGGVALILIISGFVMGTDKILSLFGFAPNDLNSAAIACANYAGQENLALSYCQYRELTIDGQKQWVNCNDVHDKAIVVLGADKVGFEKQTCVNQGKYCAEVLQNKTDYDGKDHVNGVLCAKKTG